MGIELSHCLSSEFCHRYNQKIFERRISGFPKIGHYNTWLVDLVQNLVAFNHSVRFCPNWTNASEVESTPEAHGVVPLHSKELGDAINRRAEWVAAEEGRRNVKKNDRFENKFSRDQKFLSERTGLRKTEEENKLFNHIMRERSGNFNDSEIALEWANHCNGITIFPKLPFYLRSHYEKWKRNVLTRKLVESSRYKNGQERIKILNTDSAGQSCAPAVEEPLTLQTNNTSERSTPAAALTQDDGALVVIAGTSISALVNSAPQKKRCNGERGRDSTPRQQRTCAICMSKLCPGITRRSLCPGFCLICRKTDCPGLQNPMFCNSHNHEYGIYHI